MTLSKIIAIPFFIAIATVGYLVILQEQDHLTQWFLPPVICLAALYMVHRDLDRWWRDRHPVDIPAGLMRFLKDHYPIFSLLTLDQLRRFSQSMAFYLEEIEISPQGFEKYPEDIRAAITAPIALLEALRPDAKKLFRSQERVVLYLHPFPSPQFPEDLHASEFYFPDRVTLFCVDHLIKGFHSPGQYLNLTFYEFSKIPLTVQDPEVELDPERLEEISGFTHAQVLKYIGLPEPHIDLGALTVSYFLLFPERFAAVASEKFKQLQNYFSINDQRPPTSVAKAFDADQK